MIDPEPPRARRRADARAFALVCAGLVAAAAATPAHVRAQPPDAGLEDAPPDAGTADEGDAWGTDRLPVEDEPEPTPTPSPADGDAANAGRAGAETPGRDAPDASTSADTEGSGDGHGAVSDGDSGDEAGDFLSGFGFGTYGRVVAASDLRGGTGADANIVSRAPRIDEGTYFELELRREDTLPWMTSKIVATLAVNGPLFHFDGDFAESFAIRNLFLELGNVGVEGLSLWAGSRMWRGDDVYLLDTWPLDNLNAVGGGAGFEHEYLDARLAVGFTRPNDPFQTQIVDVLPVDGFVPDEVFLLDRPRIVTALKLTGFPLGRGDVGIKATLYGELHEMAAGDRRDDSDVVVHLPADDGYVLGAQVGGWIVENRAFANVFFRYARGLGAYDPFGVPFRTGTVIDTGRAEETLLAVSLNYEVAFLGIQAGAYYRHFRDADPSLLERSLLAEGAIDLRPHFYILDWLGVALDLSYQALQTTALDERTGNGVGGSVWKLGIMPFVSPFGRGTYTRPHLRLIYAATFRDEGARALYNPLDPRSQRDVEHFLGIGAEWWIDTVSYSGPQAQ